MQVPFVNRVACAACLVLAVGCVKPQPTRMAEVALPDAAVDAPAECPPAVGAPGEACRELLGRQEILEGNRLGREGHYKDALAAFDEAERLVPQLPQLWLNKGYTCRQMLIPGAKGAGNRAAAKCALDAFRRYQELEPEDPRGEALILQTLLDTDDHEALAKIYLAKIRRNPRDLGAVNGLIAVYTKANNLDETLKWYGARTGLLADDPEAHDAVAVFVLGQLSARGGGPVPAAFDPRPDPKQPRAVKLRPNPNAGDVIGQQRVDLADFGIVHLEKALALRPGFREAMTHMSQLYLQKSFAFFDEPREWQKLVDRAEEWRKKAAAP